MRSTGTCEVFERVARGELTPEEGARLLARISVWGAVVWNLAWFAIFVAILLVLQ